MNTLFYNVVSLLGESETLTIITMFSLELRIKKKN